MSGGPVTKPLLRPVSSSSIAFRFPGPGREVVQLTVDEWGYATVHLFTADGAPILDEHGRHANHGSVRGAVEAMAARG